MEHLFDQGVTAKKFTGYVVPSVIMMIFISIYILVDAIFVARFVGSDALASINIVYPVAGLGLGVTIMLAAGSSALVAIKMGEGNARKADEQFTLICLVAIVISAVCGAFLLINLKGVVGFLGASNRLLPYCVAYARPLFLATPAAFLGTLLEYFIRVDGRPGFTLFLYVSGGVVHIFLDYLFLVRLNWGIVGAGWATSAGLVTVMVLGVGYFLTQKTKLKIVRPKWDGAFIGHSFLNGSAEMVSESSVAIMIFIFNIIVLRLAGEDGVAALTIVLNAQFLLISTHLGFVTGVGPLISYFYGAKDYEKVNRFIRYSGVFLAVSSIAIALLALAEAPLIARVFVDAGTAVYYMAVRGIRFIAASFLFTGVNVFAGGFFTAYGNGVIAALISLSRGLVLIIIGAVTLPVLFGLDGVWLTVDFAEFATVALSMFMFNRYRNKYHYGWHSAS
jgi:putative MATE family efflux protein